MTETAPTGVTNTVYASSIKSTFAFLKQIDRIDQSYAASIQLDGGLGHLIPISQLHERDPACITMLSTWRVENAKAYPTQFPVTDQGTARWIRKGLLDVVDRILFLIVSPTGAPIGHLGYASCLEQPGRMEIDNVIRGVKQGYPGIMESAMRALIAWANERFMPDEIFLRVFAENEHAIRFYEKCSFITDVEIPLRKHEDGERISFTPLATGDNKPADAAFKRMVLKPKRIEPEQWPTLISTAGPSISEREAVYALDAARNGWNHEWSKYLTRFERECAEYVGVKYAMATSSCTGALHLSLLALGIGPGDEVIVPESTWVATANAVLYVGATPVFADITSKSWCMDPNSFESLITPRTKAVMPVHLYGHPAEMDAIMLIARKHGLAVVEDAAPSIGAEYKGRRTGSFGDFSCFSFQGAKLMVTGEGGMLLTDDKALYEKAYKIWDQGRQPGGFWIDGSGWKYKMSNIQAALGVGQMAHVDVMIAAKRRIAGWYRDGLAGIPGITFWNEAEWARSIYWMSSIIVDEDCKMDRDTLRSAMKKRNIDTRSVFPAISQYPIWPTKQKPQPVAKRVGDRGINLPSGVKLSRDQVDYICNAIRASLTQ